MLARPFRFLAPTLAALGLVALRPACLPPLPQAATAQSSAPGDAGLSGNGGVVFRHYL